MKDKSLELLEKMHLEILKTRKDIKNLNDKFDKLDSQSKGNKEEIDKIKEHLRAI